MHACRNMRDPFQHTIGTLGAHQRQAVRLAEGCSMRSHGVYMLHAVQILIREEGHQVYPINCSTITDMDSYTCA